MSLTVIRLFSHFCFLAFAELGEEMAGVGGETGY